MENMTTSRLSATRNLLVMLSVVVVAVSMIVVSMPNTEQPLLYYTLGEPWLSPQLISPPRYRYARMPPCWSRSAKRRCARISCPTIR